MRLRHALIHMTKELRGGGDVAGIAVLTQDSIVVCSAQSQKRVRRKHACMPLLEPASMSHVTVNHKRRKETLAVC